VPPILYLGAIAALALSLARPTLALPTPREDATVILAIDVSGSMKATDVEPTRLAAAKDAAESFIAQLPDQIRVGLVAFASEPVTLVEPTDDREAVRTALDQLEPQDGTAMGDALMQVLDIAETVQAQDAAAAAASPDPSASPSPSATPDPGATPAPAIDTPTGEPLVAAILLSDGANSTGEADPLDAADRAAELHVPIYTIALGTTDGQVQVRDQAGVLRTLDVPPDTETLAKIAETTGATAFDAPTASDLQAVYDNLQSRVGFDLEEQEVTAIFAGGALLLVVAAAGLSALWFGRLP
jgi:Ca-activated chloride channel family protein